MKTQDGFTLVELMIVVAIVAIIAAIALAVFPTFIARAQVTAALAEIRPGKAMIEVVIYEGRSVATVTPEFLGGAKKAHCSEVSAELMESGLGHITCLVIGASSVDGRSLTLRRSIDGVWTCDGSAFAKKYRPTGC